jgi:dTDP-4-amino-4,6-dideoxygalactose transaminase
LRRQDFDQVLDAMVHDRLASGEITRQLSREATRLLQLREAAVYASVGDAIGCLIRGFGLQAGDKVILSPLSPPYWLQVLLRLGLEPLWADVLEDSPVLDPDAVKALVSQEPKLIVADACLGFLPDVEALSTSGIPVIEDISQGLGGVFAGQTAGARGAAVLVFFSPETLVAGAGGALAGFRSRIEMDEESRWEHLSDLGSALVLSQWKDVDEFAEKKREHFRYLFHRLPKGYRQPRQSGDADPVMPWFPIIVESGAKDVLAYARKKAVEADWAFRHQPQLNTDTPDFCPRARFFLVHTVVFPLYSIVSSKELELIGKVIGSLP